MIEKDHSMIEMRSLKIIVIFIKTITSSKAALVKLAKCSII